MSKKIITRVALTSFALAALTACGTQTSLNRTKTDVVASSAMADEIGRAHV